MTNLRETRNHLYCQKALDMESIARGVYLSLGEMLYKIREERLYEPFWSSWAEYCMEFKDFSQGSISKMIAVYEVFVLKYGYSVDELSKAGGWTKLYALTPHIKSKKDADKWLKIAGEQTRTDLGRSLVEAKTGISMSDCKHKNSHVIRICDDCGVKVIEHEK